MRHSAFIWIVSALVSLGVHAGLMSALAKISIEAPKDDALADVILAGDSFGAVATPSVSAPSIAEVAPSDQGQELSSASAEPGAVAPGAAPDVANESQSPAAAGSPAPLAPDSAAAEPAASDQGQIATTAPAAQVKPADATPAAVDADPAVALPSVANDVVASDAPGLAVAPPDSGSAPPQASGSEGSDVTASSGVAVPAGGGELAAAGRPQGTELKAAAPIDAAAPPPKPPAQSGTGTLPAGTKTASIATAVVSQAERIDRFLSSYKGGDCLYATSGDLDAPRPAFAGFGAERGVTDFAAAFKQAVGIEPKMAIREVMEAQCAAVDFLREFEAAKLNRVQLVLDNEVISDGGAVTGHIEGDPKGEVRLLVIGDDGAVNDISQDFHRTKGKNFFWSAAVVNAEGRARNQIMVVLVSAEPLTVSVTHQPGEAATLFHDIAAQVKAQGAKVSLGFGAFQVK